MRRTLAIPLLGLSLAGCGMQDPYSAPTSTTSTRHAAVRPATAVVDEGAPVTAARAFMRGYLPYLYGLGPAAKIAAVTPRLKRRLRAQPMTREDGASPVRPQLEALRVVARSGNEAQARAIVTDESDVYFAVNLALVRGARGWQVAALKTNGG